jgi:hypothetical protein
MACNRALNAPHSPPCRVQYTTACKSAISASTLKESTVPAQNCQSVQAQKAAITRQLSVSFYADFVKIDPTAEAR